MKIYIFEERDTVYSAGGKLYSAYRNPDRTGYICVDRDPDRCESKARELAVESKPILFKEVEL